LAAAESVVVLVVAGVVEVKHLMSSACVSSRALEKSGLLASPNWV